jgi:hypothetical protein
VKDSKHWAVLLGAGALLLAAAPAWAHHSFGAEYDANKPITLTGVVTKVEWTNPHSFFYLDVKDASGKVANWKMEGFPPNVLYRTGWKKDVTIKQGDEITVDCTRETSVHDLSDQVLEYMREIAEACSTADHKVCVYTFSVKS